MRHLNRIKVMIALFFVLCVILIAFRERIKESWNSVGVPLGYATVVIDPGHGGPDGGAHVGKILEKDIALSISLLLKERLEKNGVQVVMTREVDTDLAGESVEGLRNRKIEDLKKRRDIINGSNADLYISVHLNSMTQKELSGAQVFFNSSNSKNQKIAEIMQNEFTKSLQNTDRIAKKNNELYIMRTAEIPGVLSEVGFLSNDAERQLLINKSYQDKIAAAMERSVITFIEGNFADESN